MPVLAVRLAGVFTGESSSTVDVLPLSHELHMLRVTASPVRAPRAIFTIGIKSVAEMI